MVEIIIYKIIISQINSTLLSICEDILSEHYTKEQIVDEIMTLYNILTKVE